MTNVNGLKEFMDKMDWVSKTYDRIPNEVAAIAVKFTKERFRDQAWLDRSREKWKERSRRRPGKISQTLLVDKGYLKRSIRKIHADHRLVIIGSNAPYAQIQNDGGRISKTVNVSQHAVRSYKRKSYNMRTRNGRTVRVPAKQIPTYTVGAHQRKMNVTIPARPFIGISHTLEVQLIEHIINRFDEQFKK